MDLGIPSLETKDLTESKRLNSRFLVCGLAGRPSHAVRMGKSEVRPRSALVSKGEFPRAKGTSRISRPGDSYYVNSH